MITCSFYSYHFSFIPNNNQVCNTYHNKQHIKGSVQVVKVVIDPTVMTNTTLIPTLGSDLLICDITQISTTHTGIRDAVLIRNRLNTNWELTPLILFMKELLV